ncbi:MAG: ABC transporter substrate-binding protein [Dehalococcoidia bacterium]
MAQPTTVGSDSHLDVAPFASFRPPAWRGDRRGFLGLTGAAAVATALLSTSCFGGDSEDPTQTATATPTEQPIRRGGTLRMGQGADLNLAAGHPFAIVPQNRLLLYAAHETLVEYRTGLTPQPVLAERFEVSSDFRRVSVMLKPDLEFHNGAPVTADDVLFSVRTAQEPASAGLPPAATIELGAFARLITDINVVDARTIEFTFDQPRPNLSDFFTQLQIAHRATYGEVAQGKVAGTGPFQLASWDRGRGYRLERFPNWHNAGADGRPYLDAIDVSLFADQTTATIAFRGGNLDAYLAMSAANAAPLRNDGKTRDAGKSGMYYLGMKVSNPQLRDARVRQAIFYAVDRERMVRDANQGFGTVTTQPWAPSSPAFDPARDAPFYEPQRSRDLLAQAGWSQSDPLTIEYASGVTAQELQAQLLQADLKAVGVETRLEAVEGVRYGQRLRAGEVPDFWIAAHGTGDLTPLTLFQQTFEFRITANFSGFEDSQYVALVRRLETLAPDSGEARDVYAQLNRLMVENPFVIPTGVPQARIDLVQDGVAGWPAGPAGYAIAPLGKVDLSRVWLR